MLEKYVTKDILDLMSDEQKQELTSLFKNMVNDFSDENNIFQDGKLLVKFKNTSGNEDPKYSNEGDSGFDLRADLTSLIESDLVTLNDGTQSLIIAPKTIGVVPTGLYFDLPLGFDIDIKSRSGLAVKNGIGVLTGTVDSPYTGMIKVVLFNFSHESFVIKQGDRIAQGVIRNVMSTNNLQLRKVDEIDKNTSRNDKGFGSSGVN